MSSPPPSSGRALADSATVPVLLLKTRSAPHDGYQQALGSTAPTDATQGCHLAPHFVPVLAHRLEAAGTARLASLLRQRQIGSDDACAFGGLIFTSQRAVEALASVVDDGKGDAGWPHLQHASVYSVGPATTRALEAVPQDPPLQVSGEHTGNGEALARFILAHYDSWLRDRSRRRPLLFLVGEQRRDAISRTLMDPALPADQRIEVDEEVVYGSGVMESFPADFAAALRDTEAAPVRWVVVFSPTGCDGMLRGLGLLDPATGKVRPGQRDGKTFVATIGPTTAAHLTETFAFEPDVCAETPSPEGVVQAIVEFRRRQGGSR